MKKGFYKISSFIMALLVLFSTFSFAIENHYCGDVLVDSSLFGKVESCGVKIQQASNLEECNLTQKDCCIDEIVSMDGQDELKISFEEINKEQQLLVVSFIYSYIKLYEGTDSKILPFKNYLPPSLIRDVQTLDQTFLI